MQHLANDYIRSNVITGHSPQTSTIPQQVFSTLDIAAIKTELEKDCTSYLYSAVISFIDALNGLTRGFYSWPTVKLYYSVFYALRAYMGLKDICIFYVGKKVFSIDLNSAINAHKEGGTTHKVVLDVFKRSFPHNVLLSQDIDQKHPFDWLTDLREHTNYKNPKFCEPSTPTHFSKIENLCIATALQAYNEDEDYLYTFDDDHACVAYPLKIIRLALSEFDDKGLTFDNLDLEHISTALAQIDGATECFSEFFYEEEEFDEEEFDGNESDGNDPAEPQDVLANQTED